MRLCMAMLTLRISTHYCSIEMIHLLIKYTAHWDVDPNTLAQIQIVFL